MYKFEINRQDTKIEGKNSQDKASQKIKRQDRLAGMAIEIMVDFEKKSGHHFCLNKKAGRTKCAYPP